MSKINCYILIIERYNNLYDMFSSIRQTHGYITMRVKEPHGQMKGCEVMNWFVKTLTYDLVYV